MKKNKELSFNYLLKKMKKYNSEWDWFLYEFDDFMDYLNSKNKTSYKFETVYEDEAFDGRDCAIIQKISGLDFEIYFKIIYTYSSWNGCYFDNEPTQVWPKEVLVTKYLNTKEN